MTIPDSPVTDPEEYNDDEEIKQDLIENVKETEEMERCGAWLVYPVTKGVEVYKIDEVHRE